MLLLAFRLACPEAVFMNRGNHEQRDLNERPFAQGGGFAWECRAKYPHDENLIELFQRYAAQLWRNSFAIPSQFLRNSAQFSHGSSLTSGTSA